MVAMVASLLAARQVTQPAELHKAAPDGDAVRQFHYRTGGPRTLTFPYQDELIRNVAGNT